MCRSDTLVAKTGRSYRLSRRASMVERGICASAINVAAKSDHENWPQRRRDTERINEPLHERGQLSASHAAVSRRAGVRTHRNATPQALPLRFCAFVRPTCRPALPADVRRTTALCLHGSVANFLRDLVPLVFSWFRVFRAVVHVAANCRSINVVSSSIDA